MTLPSADRVLVVVAHPDDESFGLGSIITTYLDAGTDVSVLCFTAGEASTLGDHVDDLATHRSREMECATAALGVTGAHLRTYPDGGLVQVPLTSLVDEVATVAEGADALLTFDARGITGHPDHRRATDAAHAAAELLGLAVVEWTLPTTVADVLAAETGGPFVGTPEDELTRLSVDRTRQLEAIACHGSQATDNVVLWRRLELQGSNEWIRVTRSPRPVRPDPQ